MRNKSYKSMMVISIIIISLLFASACAQQKQSESYASKLTSPRHENEYVNPVCKWSIRYPKDWTMVEKVVHVPFFADLNFEVEGLYLDEEVVIMAKKKTRTKRERAPMKACYFIGYDPVSYELAHWHHHHRYCFC